MYLHNDAIKMKLHLNIIFVFVCGLLFFCLVLGFPLQTEPKQQQQDRKGVSVIQHTSSFEKQESVSMESQEPDLRKSEQTQQPEPKPSPSTSRLIRQPNIQVPEILVTVEPDVDMPSMSPQVTASLSKVFDYVKLHHPSYL